MSIENIKTTILQSADEYVQSTLSNAQKAKDEKLASARETLVSENAQRAEKIKADTEEIISRRLTLARLESRMNVLKIKQEVIEKAFAKATEKINNMPAKDYQAFYARLLAAYAEKGDEVRIGSGDSKNLGKEWLDAQSKALGIKLSLGAPFDGKGIILSNAITEKDLTLDTVTSECRERTEAQVAKILFG